MPEPVRFRFGTPDLPDDDPSGFGLRVVNFFGEETLSQPFWFVLNLTSRDPNLDFEAVVNQPGRLTLERGTHRCYLHGLVASFEQSGRDGDWHLYRAVLRPRLWVLSLSYRSRVFRRLSVPEIARKVLEEHGVPHTIELRGSYPTRDFTVQHEETDLAFVTRLLTSEGIRFAFAHGERREEVLLYDSRGQDPWVEGPAEVRYLPPDGLVAGVEEHVSKIVVREQVIPGRVALRDYNPGTPSADLGVEAEPEGGGPGEVYEHAQDYGDRDGGKRVAEVRREELAAQRRLVAGRGTSIGFRAGHRFTLFAHPRDDFNEDYLLVRVRHFGGQEGDFGTVGQRAFDAEGTEGNDYRNEFGCAPARVPFRMPRLGLVESFFGDTFFDARFEQRLAQTFNVNAQVNVTPLGGGSRGKATGLAVGTVVGDGAYGAVDGDGKYTVQFNQDRETQASNPVRLAQPYAGEGEAGFHFPAHAGNEMLVGFIDGDPNQPVALGFLPNAERPSPITSSNSSKHRILTTSENQFWMDDEQGKEHILLETPYGDSWLSLGTKYQGGEGATLSTDKSVGIHGDEGVLMRGGAGVLISAWPGRGPASATMIVEAATPLLLALAAEAAGHFSSTPDAIGKVVNVLSKINQYFQLGRSAMITAGRSVAAAGGPTSVADALKTLDTPAIFQTAAGGFDLVVGEGANITAGAGFNVFTPLTVGINAASDISLLSGSSIGLFARHGTVELVARAKNVRLTSKMKDVVVETPAGHVKTTAHKSIESETQDRFSVKAEEGIFLTAVKQSIVLQSDQKDILAAGRKVEISGEQGTKIEDDKSITLKCGQSTIELKPTGIVIKNGQNSIELGASGITIKGMKIVGEADTAITLDAKVKATIKGAMVETNAQSLNTVSGALVKIG